MDMMWSVPPGGYYSVALAARILGVSDGNVIRGWLRGYDKSRLGAVVDGDYVVERKVEGVSFFDLMELRFIQAFRSQGMSLQAIRNCAHLAHKAAGDRAFLRADAKFVNILKEILFVVGEETDDEVAMSLSTGQYHMADMIRDEIKKGVHFSKNTLLPDRWFFDIDVYPSIVLDPRVASGKPSIYKANVTTEALYESVAAGDSITVICDWFEVTKLQVNQAIKFESKINGKPPIQILDREARFAKSAL